MLHLRSGVGVIELTVWLGQDPSDRHWGCPIREHWGLTAHQQLSPVLQEKLAFTATATGSYAEAAAVAAKWGSPVEDATVQALVQRRGARAEAQIQVRLSEAPAPVETARVGTELAVLMVDGWLVRQRGPGWGRQKTPQPHVVWHELKTGVFYRHEHAAQTAGGRSLLAEKVVVSWQGEALELGRRLHWEGLRGGLGRARDRLVVGDGAGWIWNLAADRWRGATEVLDFYHASQHLWELGRALGGTEAGAAAWVEPRLHRLRHGRERVLLAEIAALAVPRGARGKIVRREQNYLAGHAARMHYAKVSARGWPVGSGAVESACRQQQCRFKRPGQFWTANGVRNLCALDEARRNGHWDELWTTA